MLEMRLKGFYMTTHKGAPFFQEAYS